MNSADRQTRMTEPTGGGLRESESTGDGSRASQRMRGWRGRRGWIAGGCLAAVIAIVVGVVWFSPWIVVRKIEVQGVIHGDKTAIVESSGITEGQKLIGLNTGLSARAVARQPWVDSVTVSRSWPQGVNISVKEFTPLLFIRATDGDHLFAQDGREFITATPPPGVVEVVDVPRVDQPADGKIDPKPRVIEAVIDVIRALPEAVAARTERISAPSEAEIQLYLSDGYQVYFGSADSAEAKARATEIVLSRGEKTWDVSNPAMPTTK